MYNFELTDYQKDIQMRARKFAQEEVLPGAIERDKTEVYDMELLKKLGDAGLIGLQFDPKYGGHGDDYLAFLLVVEELCKVDSAFGISYAISSTFTTGIDSFGSEEQKMHCMPRLFAGDAIGCFGLTEPDAESDAGSAKTEAVRDGDNFILNGKKHFITNSAVADYCMLIPTQTCPRVPRASLLSLSTSRRPPVSASVISRTSAASAPPRSLRSISKTPSSPPAA